MHTIQYNLRPATEADVSIIVEINHSYFPLDNSQHHDRLHRNVSEMISRGCGFLLHKICEAYVRDNISHYFVLEALSSSPNADGNEQRQSEVVGFVSAYYASFLEFDSATTLLSSMRWNGDAWKAVIGAIPDDDDDDNNNDNNNNAPNKQNYKRIYISQVAMRQEWAGKGAARSAYEQLFANADALIKPKKASSQQQQQQQEEESITNTVFYCFVVSKPYENSRSIRFHQSTCGFEQAAVFACDEYLGLKDYESVLLAKIV